MVKWNHYVSNTLETHSTCHLRYDWVVLLWRMELWWKLNAGLLDYRRKSGSILVSASYYHGCQPRGGLVGYRRQMNMYDIINPRMRMGHIYHTASIRIRPIPNVYLLNLPERIALWTLNSLLPSESVKSEQFELSSNWPKSSLRRDWGTLTGRLLDWPDIFTVSPTTLTCMNRNKYKTASPYIQYVISTAYTVR